MSFITLDFETFYDTKNKYSLRSMTYEEYIFDERFKVQGVAIKINQEPTYWVKAGDVEQHLMELFTEGNDHHMLNHNGLFDAAVLNWHYKLKPAFYYDTLGMYRGIRDWKKAGLGDIAKDLLGRRKGEDLSLTNGVYDLPPKIEEKLGIYALNDVDLTFDCFAEMVKYYPQNELYMIHWAIRSFAEPKFMLDRELAQDTLRKSVGKQRRLIKESGIPVSVLRNPQKFVDRVKELYDIEIKKIKAPTRKDPDNEKYPLAKDALQFLKLRANYPHLDHVWKGRLAAASNQEKTRAQRFLNHEQPDGTIAVALKVFGAHTLRFSGTNKVNMQNLGRKSPLRNCLRAPDGYKVIAPDFSNIEGRVSAWFCQDFDKCRGYESGVDFYNKLASSVFGYPVDRKAVDANGKKIFGKEGAIGKTGELGLGYGMGANKFWVTCAKGPMGEDPIHLEEGLAQRTVDTWRFQNSLIVAMWRRLDNAIEDMANPNMTPYMIGPIRIEYQRIRLPNGMYLNYPRLAYRKSDFKNEDKSDKYTFSYWTGQWYQDTWGGTMLENIIQALSRLIMSDSLERVDKWLVNNDLGWMVLTVHDENVGIVRADHAQECLDYALNDMRIRPTWAPELPLDAEGGIQDYYAKG